MTTATLASSAPINVVETYVAVPLAITPVAGNVYKVTLIGTVQSNIECGGPILNLRMGAAGTLADAVIASVLPQVSSFNVPQPFECDFYTTVRTLGVAGTIDAFANVQGNGNGGMIGITEINPSVVVNTTTAAYIGASVVGCIITTDQATITSGSSNIVLAPSNGVFGFGTFTPGSGYVPGQYNNVSLTGGNGSGATANFTVNSAGIITAVSVNTPGTGYFAGDTLTSTVDSGGVTSVTVTTAGTGYLVGDVLSATAATIGGTGSGFHVPVATISGGPIVTLGVVTGGSLYTPGTYTNVALTGGSGTGARGTIVVTAGGTGFTVYLATLVGGPNAIGLVGINNPISFATTVGTVGGQVVAGTVYYIVSTNVGPTGLIDTIQVSAISGGTPITFNASGTTHTTLGYDCTVIITQAICSQL